MDKVYEEEIRYEEREIETLADDGNMLGNNEEDEDDAEI